jgi:hypothetical protein
VRLTADTATQLEPLRRRWLAVGPWLALTALLLLQQVLLRQYALREITWAYPTNFDQVQYLSQSYDTYVHIQADGLLPGLGYGLRLWAPQGMLIHLQASLLFVLLGPSRLSALTLNFIYFALFQVTLVGTLRWLTRRWDIALLGLGLLLAARSPFFDSGGLMDFRIDFIAFCLFGTLICLVIRSGMFASWRWSLAVGALAILLVLFRFLTATYLVGIFGGFGLFLCARLLRSGSDLQARAQLVRQLSGLGLAGALFLLVVLPALWGHREQLWSYYGIGHFAGQEKEIRARAGNISNILIAVLYYPRSVVVHHAGAVFTIVGLLALATTAAVFRDRLTLRAWFLRQTLDIRINYLFLAICLVVPYIILTLDVAKSAVVGNIFLPIVLWLLVITVIALTRSASVDSNHLVMKSGMIALAALSMGAGMIYQSWQLSRLSALSQHRSDTEQVIQIHDLIFEYSRQHGLTAPRVSNDHIVDYINANVLNVVIYERHGVFLNSAAGIGTSIFAPSDAEVIEQVQQSDFVILSTPQADEQLVFPFDIAMQALHPNLVALCDQHFEQLRRFQIANRDLVLYARRN